MIKYIDKLADIYRYEMITNVPDEDKTVEFLPDIKMYKLKKVLDNQEVSELYATVRPLLDKYEHKEVEEEIELKDEIIDTENDNVVNIIVPSEEMAHQKETITLVKNLQLKDSKVYVGKVWESGVEYSTYAYKNYLNAIKRYLSISGAKEIGYEYETEKYAIVSNPGIGGFSEIVISEDSGIELFKNYYTNVFYENIHAEEELQLKREKEQAEAEKRAAELRINPIYQKNYLKTVKQKKSVCLRNIDFSGYDFRGIDISNTVFVDCSFKKANLTDLKVSNSIWIHCDITDLIQDGTVYNSCEYIQCMDEK